jgi:hypothetical protein
VFQINGIPAGSYEVGVTPEVGSSAEKIIPAVVVVNGEIKDIGDITQSIVP